jgi:polyhydroxybutyrate depolymerase
VQNNVDDIGFVRDLLATADDRLCVDDARIYSTGMSNGGFLSHRIGCELSDRIAAIAPVAGVNGMTSCAPSRPVPLMHFHGTADPLVPYTGSTSLGFISVPDSFAAWGARDGCTGDPVETFRNGDSHCATYQQCGAGADVTPCTVDNGGHTWPGGLPVPSLGNTTTDLNATDAMWTFFEAHPLR